MQKLVDDGSFALAICVTMLITGIIPPTIQAIHKPVRHFVAYRRRSVQKSKGELGLRILSCVHNPRSVPALISLLRACQPTKKFPLTVFALHLLEQTSGYTHASTTMIGQHTTSTSVDRSHEPQSDHIAKAFENFERTFGVGVVTVRTLTTISPYSSMYEEICDTAEDKGIALIILPFHKHQSIDGGMEETSPFFREINDNVLNNAPCTVAILVDRGFGGGSGDGHDVTNINSHNIVVLFFGGPDDREALSLAWKMAEKPNVKLTVFRFIPTDDALKLNDAITNEMGALKLIIDNERERQRDEDYINVFRYKISNKQSSIVYLEKVVNDGEETLKLIKSIDNVHDLFIVGRGRGMVNPLTASLIDFSECPELGAIGDLLASPDFSMTTTSVLIVQQYVGAANEGGSSGAGTPTSQYSELYDNFHNINQMSPSNSNGAFAQRRVKKFSTGWN
ncbi:hypothetical protein BVC80_8633g3 [Macleaya cordata]|uniref:Cation/H+ exchanger n=1 Tax=Macleaya cordata TaxID=56857 RepID=A0A200QIW1_MACCD|nr:hypothetical protein BVC80_8633g3 [Macleaya cordata]